MIIDCHAHVFQNWHGACGHSSIDVHLKYIQKNVTRPAAETFRLRDGKRVKPGLLFREGDNTWTGLKDVDFRIGRNGRLEFMHEGEEYAIQYMPVGMQTIEVSARIHDRADALRGRRSLPSCRRAADTAR